MALPFHLVFTLTASSTTLPCLQAISHLALELLREYNCNCNPRRGAVVYNTYQAYLKHARKQLIDDLERAKRQGYVLGAKLVRGAYVKLERERAQEMGYESPICDTIEDTHNNYNSCMQVGRWSQPGFAGFALAGVRLYRVGAAGPLDLQHLQQVYSILQQIYFCF